MNLRRVIVFFALILWIPVLNAQAPLEAVGFSGIPLHLYPLGWSSEGRWGAIIGNTKTKQIWVKIIDAVTDEILYESNHFPWLGPDSFLQFWNLKEPVIRTLVKNFDLEMGEQPDVRDAQFITGGVKYTFSMTPGSPASGSYTLGISSSRGDSKIVYQTAKASIPKQAQLMGAMVSPFEQRALAIVIETDSKDQSTYRFSGAHLTLGFSTVQSLKTLQPGIPRGSLITAVFNGQEYLVKSRLAAGADPNIRDSRGYPVILIAARLGHWEMVRDLLAAGAEPNPRDMSGRSALHYAAFAGNGNAVKALLTAGAKTKIRDGAGRIPADLAVDTTIRKLLR